MFSGCWWKGFVRGGEESWRFAEVMEGREGGVVSFGKSEYVGLAGSDDCRRFGGGAGGVDTSGIVVSSFVAPAFTSDTHV